MRVVIERAAQEADAVARVLASEGHDVRIADLDADAGEADVAYLDVWTPEVALRVAALRARGVRVTTSSELVLERAVRAGALTVGVTGTAGKSTASSFLVQLLGSADVSVLAAADGRLGHRWVTGSVVDGLASLSPSDVVVIELTSSHLAFMASSPDVAVVTCFWPDHLELHGSLAAYRAAKEAIVRGQAPSGAVVVNADDPVAASFVQLTPARRFAFSAQREVEAGAFVRDRTVVLRRDGEEAVLGDAPAEPTVRQAVLAAGAGVAAAGAPLAALEGAVAGLTPPPHRRQPLGSLGGATLVVDDGMAATPAKARAALAGFADNSVVLIAGGRDRTEGGAAHASPEERVLLDAACDEAARSVRVAVLFGAAAAILEPRLTGRGVAAKVVPDLEAAFELALAATSGAAVVLFAPFFPVSAPERERFAALARRLI
jgi:UDP-N-acetylmuramoylalanine--D-glutamate ligase